MIENDFLIQQGPGGVMFCLFVASKKGACYCNAEQLWLYC